MRSGRCAAGAQGYVNKQEPIHEMIAAIRRVLQGEIHLSPKMTNFLLQRVGGAGFEQDPVAGLSDREMEVFRMIGRGMTTQQIAGKLGIKPKTVETHREKVKAKLNLRNGAELNQHRAVDARKRLSAHRRTLLCPSIHRPFSTGSGWSPLA